MHGLLQSQCPQYGADHNRQAGCCGIAQDSQKDALTGRLSQVSFCKLPWPWIEDLGAWSMRGLTRIITHLAGCHLVPKSGVIMH
jgi:hypothetical protein